MSSSKQTQTQVRNGPFTCVSEQTAFLTPSGLLAARKILNCFYDWPAPAQSRAEFSQHDTVSSQLQTEAFLLMRPTTFYGLQGFKYPTWNKIYCWVMIIVLDSDCKVWIFNSSQKTRDIFDRAVWIFYPGRYSLMLLPSSHSPSEISGKLGGSWHRSMMSMDKSVGNGGLRAAHLSQLIRF